MKKITKAVLPVAGLGTRFLPATKAIPKEMLPIIDKPLIEYAVEEAVMAGIEEIIFITSHTKPSIENHFSQNLELEEKLMNSGNTDALKKINREIFNVGFRNQSVNELADDVKNVIGDDIKIINTKSDDNRSYHVSSEKIKQILNFETKYTVKDAVLDLKNEFEKKSIWI